MAAKVDLYAVAAAIDIAVMCDSSAMAIIYEVATELVVSASTAVTRTSAVVTTP